MAVLDAHAYGRKFRAYFFPYELLYNDRSQNLRINILKHLFGEPFLIDQDEDGVIWWYIIA